jgi:hypothetical protein
VKGKIRDVTTKNGDVIVLIEKRSRKKAEKEEEGNSNGDDKGDEDNVAVNRH